MSDPVKSPFEEAMEMVSAISPIVSVVWSTIDRIAQSIQENQRLNDQEKAVALAVLRGVVRVSVQRALDAPVYDPKTGTVTGTNPWPAPNPNPNPNPGPNTTGGANIVHPPGGAVSR